MKSFFIFKVLNILFRISLFTFSYLLYLIQLVFIFINLKNFAKNIFNFASYFCSLSLGISYQINKKLRSEFLREGIHISNHDNPLDIFVAQYLFQKRTITTVDQHLKNFLPFFEVSLKNYGHYCFNYKNFKERKLAYKFLKKICINYKTVLIYPSGSIYTSIKKRLSKSVANLSKNNHLKVIAWKISFDDKSDIEYKRNISKYILQRFFAKKIILKIDKLDVFNPYDYESHEDLHEALINFYSD